MKIHILGVCGTYMGGLAQIAKDLGHKVEGSDGDYYEPMASQLAKAKVVCHRGFDATCADRPADLYVVGNVIRRGNDFFEDILRNGLPFCSGPDWMARNFLPGNRRVISVAGTHGKTTTTTMVVHILKKAGLDPGYLVGGVLADGRSACLGSGNVAVIEADEYDTALFDKRPKFVHYWADVIVINNIEFDHADIYEDLPAVMRQFGLLPRNVKPGGTVVANWADANVRKTVPKTGWHDIAKTNSRDGGWSLARNKLKGPKTELEMKVGLPAGRHNRDNFLSAVAACEKVGVAPKDAIEAMADFSLPMRRMELVYQDEQVALVDDFAHHPTAIGLVIKAAKSAHKGKRVIVLFEPRSNTMRSGHWQGRLAESLKDADEVLALGKDLRWDLAAELRPLGKKAHVFKDATRLGKAAVKTASMGNALVLMLSNGDFCGLREKLPRDLAATGTG